MPTVIFFARGIWSHKQLGRVRPLRIACEDAGFKFFQPSYVVSLELSVATVTIVLAVLCVVQPTSRWFCFLLFCVTLVLWLTYTWTVDPISQAARFVKSVVDQRGSDDIILGGEADGAHVASLLCTNHFFLEQAGVNPLSIKGCFCIDGVFSDKLLDARYLKRYFGSRICYFDVFPIYNLHHRTTPPTLTVAHKGDVQSYNYHYALLQSGIWGEILYDEHREQETMKRIVRFVSNISSLKHDP